MRASLWERLTLSLERFRVLRPLLLRYDGQAPSGRRYVNRLNGHVVVITESGELR